MDDPNVLIKGLSAVGGAVLGLLFRLPRSMTEFWRRLVFSTGVGFALGNTVLSEYLHWPVTYWNVVAAIVLTAFLSWFIAPIVLQAFKTVVDLLVKKKT